MKKLLLTALFGAAIAMPYIAQAATDGTLGSTSEASMNISLTSAGAATNEVQITGLQDINFGSIEQGTTPSPIRLGRICVFMSEASTYSIEITPHAPAGAQLGLLFSELGLDLTYSWRYETSDGGFTVSTLGSNFVGSSTAGCSSATFASFTVSPNSVSGTGNEDVVYTGSITLTVSPE